MKITLKNPPSHSLKRFSTANDGAVAIEVAFAMIFLFICLIFLVELFSYIRAKDQMNKISDMYAALASTMPPGDEASIARAVQELASVSAPYGASLAMVMCDGNGNVWRSWALTANNASCNFGRGGTARAAVASCVSSVRSPHVVAEATCAFSPIISGDGASLGGVAIFGGLIPVQATIRSQAVVPVRYELNWN